ncbi:hypothetical protein Gohar_011533, partial [Gossypium harknessii]|nr:hypothetical protein [Gossypium harknessii]
GLALLAASAQNRCTALVCSCYVPSRNSSSKEEEIISNRSSSSSNIKKRTSLEKNIKDGVMEEAAGNNNNNDELQLSIDKISNGSGTNGSHIEPNPTLKSNLKKTTTAAADDNDGEGELMKTERRKVSWPDAHGKDIAYVREFEPSVSDDGELEGVRRSCVCVIQ